MVVMPLWDRNSVSFSSLLYSCSRWLSQLKAWQRGHTGQGRAGGRGVSISDTKRAGQAGGLRQGEGTGEDEEEALNLIILYNT